MLLDLIPAPYRIAAFIGSLLAVCMFGAWAGKTWESNARDAAEFKRSEAVRKEESRLSGIAYDIGMELARGHASADADRTIWEKERKVKRAYVKVDCESVLQSSAAGTAAVRLDADFVRLHDAGLCIGAQGDCQSGADDALPAAPAPG